MRHRIPQAAYPNPVRAAPDGFLFGLAPSGVCLAIYITADAVVSYTHLFTLTNFHWR